MYPQTTLAEHIENIKIPNDTPTRKVLTIADTIKNQATYIYSTSEGNIKRNYTNYPNYLIPCDFCNKYDFFNEYMMKSSVQYNYVNNNKKIVKIHQDCNVHFKTMLSLVSYIPKYVLLYCSLWNTESNFHILGFDIIHYLGKIITKYYMIF